MTLPVKPPRVVADVHITSDAPLTDVAALVGKALWLTFVRELTGRYAELPAFVSQGIGLHFALVGPPSGSTREPGCALEVDPLSRRFSGPRIDISEFLAAVITERAGLLTSARRRAGRRR